MQKTFKRDFRDVLAGSDMGVAKVVLSTFFPRHTGGLQTHFDLLHESLEKEGFEVIALQRGSLHRSIVSKIIVLLNYGLHKERAICHIIKEDMNAFADLLTKIVEKSRCDLLHCHDVFSAFCARSIELPLVLTVHGPLHREYKMMGWKDTQSLQWLFNLEQMAYRRADRVIAVDMTEMEYVVNEFRISPCKVKVIRNAVDVEKIWALSQLNWEQVINEGFPFVLVPRRLVPKNGVSIAVKAMCLLKSEPFKLLIAGDGPEKKKINKLVKNYHLQNKVVLLGEVQHEKIFSIIKHSFAVVIPSVPTEGVIEATSLSALEAMALGKVVIASNIGGLRELINDGVDGFLFEPGNEEHLARVIATIFRDKRLRDRVGMNAMKKVLSKYSVSTWLQQVKEIYKEAYEHFYRNKNSD